MIDMVLRRHIGIATMFIARGDVLGTLQIYERRISLQAGSDPDALGH